MAYFVRGWLSIFVDCENAFRLYFDTVPPGAALPELKQFAIGK